MGIVEKDLFVEEMRTVLGLTRSQLARFIGCSVVAIREMEKGSRNIGLSEMFMLFLTAIALKEKKLNFQTLSEEQFSSLVKWIRGQDWTLPERKQSESREIVEKLLEGEFKGRVRQKIITFLVDTEKEAFVACVLDLEKPFHLKNVAVIFIMASIWKTYPDFNSDDLREVLRHELLHVELDAEDVDLRFIAEAKRRGIMLKYSSRRKR